MVRRPTEVSCTLGLPDVLLGADGRSFYCSKRLLIWYDGNLSANGSVSGAAALRCVSVLLNLLGSCSG
jgi:hypothetical protein